MLKKRNIFFGSALQLRLPGTGHMYLGHWLRGTLQFSMVFVSLLLCLFFKKYTLLYLEISLVGFLWSFFDGVSMVWNAEKTKSNKYQMVPSLDENMIAGSLQLLCFGFGHFYKKQWSSGIFRISLLFLIKISYIFYCIGVVIAGATAFKGNLLGLDFSSKIQNCYITSFILLTGMLLGAFLVIFWLVKEAKHFYSKSSCEFNKDRLLAGLLQVLYPGFGMLYLGRWIQGGISIILFFGGLIWFPFEIEAPFWPVCIVVFSFLLSSVDGHRILTNPDEKDGKGNLLGPCYLS